MHGGYLGSERRWRTRISLRYASVSRQIDFDPEISEWGNPAIRNGSDFVVSKVATIERTEGTETSKYLEEEKLTKIPLVAASERGTGQTGMLACRGCRTRIKVNLVEERSGKVDQREWKSRTWNWWSWVSILSRTGHVKPCLNLGRPLSKPKYYLLTDSEQVPWGKDEKNPDKGSEIELETVHLQSVEGLL